MTSHARLEITVHLGLKIRVGAIFLFAYRVKTSFFYMVDVACSIYLYLVLKLYFLMKGQQIFWTHLVTFICQKKMWKYPYDISVSESCIDPNL